MSEFQKIFTQLFEKANKGDAEAQFQLGKHYGDWFLRWYVSR